MKPITQYTIAGLIVVLVACGLSLVSHSESNAVVQGWVLLDGVPLSGVTVFLLPDVEPSKGSKSAPPLPATTDRDGGYRLPTGAAPGKYRVVIRGSADEAEFDRITSLDSSAMDSTQMEMAAAARDRSAGNTGAERSSKPRRDLPAQYSSLQHTTLRLVVPPGGIQDAAFQLHRTESAQTATSKQVQ